MNTSDIGCVLFFFLPKNVSNVRCICFLRVKTVGNDTLLFFRNPHITPAFMFQNPRTAKSKKAQVSFCLLRVFCLFFPLILLLFSLLRIILWLLRLRFTVMLHVLLQPHGITHTPCRAARSIDSLYVTLFPVSIAFFIEK